MGRGKDSILRAETLGESHMGLDPRSRDVCRFLKVRAKCWGWVVGYARMVEATAIFQRLICWRMCNSNPNGVETVMSAEVGRPGWKDNWERIINTYVHYCLHVYRYLWKSTQETMVVAGKWNSVLGDRRILSYSFLWISLLQNIISWISTTLQIYTGKPRIAYWSLRFWEVITKSEGPQYLGWLASEKLLLVSCLSSLQFSPYPISWVIWWFTLNFTLWWLFSVHVQPQ